MATLVSLFGACALAVCVALRFPPLHAPLWLASTAFVLAGAALGAVVAAEAHMKRGDVGPLWMRVKVAPRLAFALALSFATTTIAQLVHVSLGPVDPTFPARAPAATNALWFFVFTIGFVGIGVMSAPGIVLPLVPTRLWRKIPLVLAVPASALVGAGLGVVIARLLVMRAVADDLARARDFSDAHAQLVTGALLALTLAPGLFSPRSDPSTSTGP